MAGIGFFAPLPLALMMPFMAGQSMLMGDAFGKAYQYGKRKISAMSNEEFNKLTPTQLGQDIATDYSAMIPSLQTAIKQSSEFQSMIIQELAKIIRSVPTDIISGITGNQELGNTLQTNLQSNITGGADVLQGITNFFNSLSSGFNAYADSSGSNNTPGLQNLQYGDVGDIGPPDPTDKIIMYINMTKTQLLNAQPSQVSWVKAQPNFHEYELAWQIAMAKFDKPKTETKTQNIYSADQDFLVINKRYEVAWTKFVQEKNIYDANKNTSFNKAKTAKKRMQLAITELKALSTKYNDPNDLIRKLALQIKKQFADGAFKYQVGLV